MNTVTLKPVARADLRTVWHMQIAAFADLLKKYDDYETNPGAEPFEKVLARFDQPWTFYYFILSGETPVGVIRIVDKRDGSRKRISPLWIMPEHRGKGCAQAAISAAEALHGPHHWSLDTILQEPGNLHLYEKMGYHPTGQSKNIKDGMDIVYYEKD